MFSALETQLPELTLKSKYSLKRPEMASYFTTLSLAVLSPSFPFLLQHSG